MNNPIKSQIAANRERFDEKFVFWKTRKNLKYQKKMVIQTPEKLKDFLTTSQTSLLQTAITAVEGLKLTQKIALPEELKIAIRSGDWSKVQWWVEHSLLDEHNFGISKVVELLKGGIE
jgi:hypothetical protein